MTVETHNEMGDPVNKKLIAEIMGKYSNIILTSDQGTIFDAIRRVDEEMSSVREVMPGRLYRLPPAQDKTAADDFETFADSSDTATAKAILNTLSGFSPTLCKAVCRSAGVDPQRKTRELALAERERLNAALGNCLLYTSICAGAASSGLWLRRMLQQSLRCGRIGNSQPYSSFRENLPFRHFFFLPPHWPSSISVSYTHLDVYKRQSS